MVTQKEDSPSSELISDTATQKFKFSSNLNVDFLEKTYGGNMIFGQKMFKIFLDSVEQDIERLRKAVDASQFQEIKDISHKIKNNFTWVGLPDLSAQMYSIENLARDEKPVAESFIKLNAAFLVSIEDIKNEYQRITDYQSNN